MQEIKPFMCSRCQRVYVWTVDRPGLCGTCDDATMIPIHGSLRGDGSVVFYIE